MLILSRTAFKKFLRKTKKTPTNADRFIGQTALVTATINNEQPSGEVLVGWQRWAARSDDGSIIPEGASVKVIRIEGVKLIVHAINAANE
jgi:membrane protein implicated in regulation of membrane protease activity